ncbi:TPA: CPBP family intramembrane metalloprotease, partial [archaeon]|nr:CPBP family intramembrane metalloprotease [Candidatus Naiadarchaeum limnaeum]
SPLVEEIVLRLMLLTYLLTIFEPLTAIIISTTIYMIYADLVYGPPFIAEALVTGILFGFAFLEVGIIPVLIAHFLYRPIRIIW